MINVHVTRCRLQKVTTLCVNLTALERCIHNWECCAVEKMREFKLHIILEVNYWNNIVPMANTCLQKGSETVTSTVKSSYYGPKCNCWWRTAWQATTGAWNALLLIGVPFLFFPYFFFFWWRNPKTMRMLTLFCISVTIPSFMKYPREHSNLFKR